MSRALAKSDHIVVSTLTEAQCNRHGRRHPSLSAWRTGLGRLLRPKYTVAHCPCERVGWSKTFLDPRTCDQAVSRVAEHARNESWSYEDFLTVLLDQEVLARQAQGGEARIRAAHFPARKTVEEFDFAYQTSLRQQMVLHLATLSFIEARDNVIFLGPPGTGKTHLAVALGMKACLAGQPGPVRHGDPVGDALGGRQP